MHQCVKYGRVLACAALFGVVCGWDMQVHACIVRSNHHVETVPCSCDAGSECDGELSFIGYDEDTVVEAATGESGYTSHTFRQVKKSTGYPCESDVEWLVLLSLVAGITICTIACAGIETGVGVVVCVSCLSANGWTGAPCTLYTCVRDYDSPVDIMGDEIESLSGSCVGIGT